MRHPKILYLLADGARARFVERSPQTEHFVTISEIDARDRLETLRHELRGSPPVANRQSGTPQRHAVGPDSFVRDAKEAFAAEVADRAAEICRKGEYLSIFIAAPSRLTGPIQQRLEGKAAVSGVLEKDLTKSPDETLETWLGGLTAA